MNTDEGGVSRPGPAAILADEAPYVFLYYSLGYASVNKRIGGVRATPLGISADDGILNWYVK